MASEKQEDELFVFARFHAREGQEDSVAEAIRQVSGPTREGPGCLFYDAYRSVRDPRLFFIHSIWIDDAAFNTHAELPHTGRFIERVQELIDHELEVNRTHQLRK